MCAAAGAAGGDDGEIEFSGIDKAHEVVGDVFNDGELDGWVALGALGDQRLKNERGDGRQDAEADFSRGIGAAIADVPLGGAQFVEDALGVGEKAGASFGEDDTAGEAIEEGLAEFGFKFLNLLAEGGLGDADFFGCARKAFFLGEGDEVTELMDFHGAIG